MAWPPSAPCSGAYAVLNRSMTSPASAMPRAGRRAGRCRGRGAVEGASELGGARAAGAGGDHDRRRACREPRAVPPRWNRIVFSSLAPASDVTRGERPRRRRDPGSWSRPSGPIRAATRHAAAVTARSVPIGSRPRWERPRAWRPGPAPERTCRGAAGMTRERKRWELRGVPYPPIVLDRAANRPLYRQIEVSLRRSILDGRIGPGTVLPGIRAYAKHLGVAAVTVMTAYDQLTAEGYLEPRPGRGTLVAPDLPDIRRGLRTIPAPASRPSRRSGRPVRAAPFFGGARREPRYDFRTGATRLDLFPVALWERLLPRAWRDLVSDPASATTYRYPEGDPRLRAELAAYLGLSRAVRTSPEQVVVTAGAQSAMATAARVWLGDRADPRPRGPRQPAPAADLRGVRDPDDPRPGRRPRAPRRPPARRPGRRHGHAVVAVPQRRHDAGRPPDAAARLGRRATSR